MADMLYRLNSFWMLSGFLYKNRHILYEEIHEREENRQGYDFMEPCNFEQDIIFFRMFQVMGSFRIGGNVVNGEMGSTRDIHWMKAYPATVSSGKKCAAVHHTGELGGTVRL